MIVRRSASVSRDRGQKSTPFDAPPLTGNCDHLIAVYSHYIRSRHRADSGRRGVRVTEDVLIRRRHIA